MQGVSGSIWINTNWRLTFVYRDALASGPVTMHNPTHRGEFITGCIIISSVSIRQVTGHLSVSASTFQPLSAGESRVTPDMALRFSRVLGRSAASWLSLQDSHNLWQVRQWLDSVGAHSDGAHAGMKGLLTSRTGGAGPLPLNPADGEDFRAVMRRGPLARGWSRRGGCGAATGRERAAAGAGR